MLIDQRHELFIFRDTARRCLGRGDDSLLIVNHAMVLITRTRVASALAHQRRVRIAFAHHPIIARLKAVISSGVPLITDSLAASASTKLPSTCSLLPSTSPASTHWATVRTNKLSNTSLPQRARALLSTL